MDGNPRVVFNSVKKNYNHGEDITVYFTCVDYKPEVDDWIGIFVSAIEPCDTPFNYEWVSVSADNKDTVPNKHTVTIKTDFISGNISLFQLRYVDGKRTVIGKSSSFSLTPFGNQGSFITVKEGVFSDDSLVLIDKINGHYSEKGQEQLDMSLVSKSDDDFLNIVPSLRISDESAETQVGNHSETERSSAESTDSTNVNKQDIYQDIERRNNAEKALEIYARTMSKQMHYIQEQGDDLVELQHRYKQQESLNQCLNEECEVAQETADNYAQELTGVKNIATNYKHECSRLRKKHAHAEEMMDRLKNQILDEHSDYQEKYETLRENAAKEIKLQHREIKQLEETMQTECEQSDSLRKELKNIEENHLVVISKLAETMDTKNAEIDSLKEKLEEMTEKYENKSTDKEIPKHEQIIDRLEKELKTEIENRSKCCSDYEKNIEELESRVVNESTKASRVENDVVVAENRFKEATDDIKFFRQKVLETEQKLQVSQNQLAKANEEIFNLRVLISSDTTDTESISRMSVMSDTTVDDKSTMCGSSCVSASTSVENLPDRQRQMGDMTDDEDSWCARSQSFDSLSVYPPSSKGKSTAGIIQVRKDIIKSVSDTTTSEKHGALSQPIPIVNTRRPEKKGRRKYGKPIDLTPSTSATTVSSYVSERSNMSFQKYDNNNTFSKNVGELDRSILEKQYIAIRQHRNSLIRENNYLKTKVGALKSDLIYTEKNLQNISLEAEHKIGMLLVTISNQEFVSPQEIQSLMQMFPFSSPEYMVPTFQQQQQSTTEEIPNTSAGGFLSPYAPEYKPNNQSQYPSSLPLYLPSTALPYMQYMANQENSEYIIPTQSVPSQLPATPGVLNNDLVDASDQLAAIGIPISKTF